MTTLSFLLLLIFVGFIVVKGRQYDGLEEASEELMGSNLINVVEQNDYEEYENTADADFDEEEHEQEHKELEKWLRAKERLQDVDGDEEEFLQIDVPDHQEKDKYPPKGVARWMNY